MRSPAAAFAWEIRRHHRWGFRGIAAYLVALAVFRVLVRDDPATYGDEQFAFMFIVPVTIAFTYLLGIFCFGLTGDLAARESIFPRRLLTLPLTNSMLAGLPMLLGSASMLTLWLATRLLAPWPAAMHVPLLWPGVFAAALLAWSQALTWMPYGLVGLRVVVAMLWLATIDTIALLALHFHAHEVAMLAIAAPQLPLAFLLARTAVARSRRGDVPGWGATLGGVTGLASLRAAPAAFRSASDAQRWFEFRRHGRSLPAVVAMLLPFELALLWLARDATPLVFDILGMVLFTPPIMATFAAATVRSGGSSPGASPFIMTKPVTNEALARATLRAAARSTALAWLLVLGATPLALWWSGTLSLVAADVARMWRFVGAPRTTAVMLLVSGVLVLTTWRLLVQGLYIAWSGRSWLRKGSVFLALVLLTAVGPLAHWVEAHPPAIAALWRAIPATLAVLALAKLCAGAWVVARIHRDGLVHHRTLVAGAACWCVAVLTLHGALVWIMDTHFFPHYVLAYLAILAVPLGRVAAGPLALDWSRHQ